MNHQKSLITKIGELIDQYRNEQTQGAIADTNIHKRHRAKAVLQWLLPNGGTILVALFLVFTQRVWANTALNPENAPGPSATTVNYQGRLANAGGTPQTGTFGMSFSIWDASTNGNLIWGPENHSAVPVSAGLFTVGLGSQTAGGIPTTVWNGDRYLQIIVSGETLSPRELIRGVPIAGMALTVPNGAITSEMILDGAVTSDEILNGAITSEKITPSVFDAYLTSSLPIGASNTEVLPLNINFPVDATYLIFIRISSTHGQGGGRVISSVQDENGVTITGTSMHTYHAVAGDAGTFTNSTSTIQDFSAGTHTLKLMASVTNGTGTVRGAHIIVVPFSQAP